MSSLCSVYFKRRVGARAGKENALGKAGGDTQVRDRLLQATQNLSLAARWVQYLPALGLQNPRIQHRHRICQSFADSGSRRLLTQELSYWAVQSSWTSAGGSWTWQPSLAGFLHCFGQLLCPRQADLLLQWQPYEEVLGKLRYSNVRIMQMSKDYFRLQKVWKNRI